MIVSQLGYSNKQLEQLKFQCNLKLLQRRVIMLFGFPSINIESDKIHAYLQGIHTQSEFEQLKKLRVLISFIGEVTQINAWDDRCQIIKQRVLQFFNIQGLEIRWSDQQWLNEIDSIVTFRFNNPYYDTIPNNIFSYISLFNILGIKLPQELKYLKHQSFKQIQTSNLIDDFHLLCNIDEFNLVRKIRIFIQDITDRLNEFMTLIINLETLHSFDIQSIKNHYSTLCDELQNILISFTPTVINQDKTKDLKKQLLVQDQNHQEKKPQITLKKTILTNSSTTIIQRTFETKTKKQKKKIKQEDYLNCRSSLLYLSENVDNSFTQIRQSQNSSQIYDNENNNGLISQAQNQLLNNADFQQFKIIEYSLENIKSKILTYEYIQYKLEQLGYPCINLNEKYLISVLQENKLFNQNKKTLIEKLFNIISESFIFNNSCLDVNKQISDQAIKYLSQISIHYPKKEFNQILKAQCILKSKMQEYDNFKNQKFSYEKLSQILNRKFPQQVYQIKCSSTKAIFQQWGINQLLDIFNFQDLQNIRVTRSYINQVCTCLQELINFKEQLQSNINVIQEFMQIEKQFLDVINQPLNFHIDSQYDQNQNLMHLQYFIDDDIFSEQIKQQILQIQDIDIIKEMAQNQENDKIYKLNQTDFYMFNLNYINIQDQSNFLYSHNQLDSPRFSFINKSQQQSDDQLLDSYEEEFYS
ncbi:unnamed protein product [Paramecium primaurelia]|uniref:Uncharacterized protein n=1 Tax=Paramecium primaurelia TaxID=5886 RepID=A0A8S1K0U6_PARPR|nr:unnamed protein product [Paramecium primaurelia]